MGAEGGIGTPTARTFRVSTGASSGTAIFHLEGDLAAAKPGELRRELSPAVGQKAVLIDMTGVVFADQVSVGVIMGVIRNVQEQGGRVVIAGADPRRGIARALRIAGTDHPVGVTDSASLALEWLATAASPEFGPGAAAEMGPEAAHRLIAAASDKGVTN